MALKKLRAFFKRHPPTPPPSDNIDFGIDFGLVRTCLLEQQVDPSRLRPSLPSLNPPSMECWDGAPPRDSVCDLFGNHCVSKAIPAAAQRSHTDRRVEAEPLMSPPMSASSTSSSMASAAKAYAKQVVKLESQNDLLVTENENLLAANEDLQAQNEELRLKQDRLAACLQDLDRDLSQAFAVNFKLSREHDRLRKVIRQANHDWAEWVKTRNQLGKDAEFMRDVVCERFDKIAELEREKKRLQRLVKVLQASRWRSRSRLKRWLVEGENQTAEMESEVTRLKILLNENLEERKAFAEEAWELWDSLVAADTRQAIGDRARKALSRLSARFTWDSTDSTLCSHKTACTHR